MDGLADRLGDEALSAGMLLVQGGAERGFAETGRKGELAEIRASLLHRRDNVRVVHAVFSFVAAPHSDFRPCKSTLVDISTDLHLRSRPIFNYG